MPHVVIKMYKGRTEEQKKALALTIKDDLIDTLGIGPGHISVAFEDYEPCDWHEVERTEIDGKIDTVYIKGGEYIKE